MPIFIYLTVRYLETICKINLGNICLCRNLFTFVVINHRNMARDIYITWHYTTHGIAYMKHILSCFYEKHTTDASVLGKQKYEQDYCNSIFDNNTGNKLFDKVYYLTTRQEVVNKVSSRLHYHNMSFENDEVLQAKGLVEVYDDLRTNTSFGYDVDKELQYVKEKYSDKYADFEQYMWRDIQHYEIKEQVKWLKEKTNFFNVHDENKI